MPAIAVAERRISSAETFSPAPRRLDRSDVDLCHLHHRLEGAFRSSGVRIGYRVDECNRGDLPRQTPSILAPAARALGTAVSDDRVPVAVRLRLVGRRHLERECLVVLERGTTVQAE